MTRLRILFVTPYVPSPVRVRPYNFVRQLSRRGHRVTVAALCTSDEEEEAARALAGECERVQPVRVRLGRALWRCMREWPTGAPFQALYAHAPGLEQVLKQELQRSQAGTGGDSPYDLLHVEHLRAALFGLNVRGLPRVYDSVDCISRLLESASKMAASPAVRWAARVDLNRTRRFEGQLVGNFDCSLVTSEPDKQALVNLAVRAACANGRLTPQAEAVPAQRITVLPSGVDLQYFQPSDVPRQPAELLYIGRMSYHANVTAALEFAHTVMPLVWAQRADARLVIVGSHPAPSIRRLASRYGPRIVVTGHVPDTRPFLARATVSVSPLPYAVGIQNKVLEAMAMATPVVASPAACAALQVEDGRHLLIADKAPDCADHILRLFDDVGLRLRLAEYGRQYVERHHDWSAIGSRLEDTYGDAVTRFRAQPSSMRRLAACS